VGYHRYPTPLSSARVYPLIQIRLYPTHVPFGYLFFKKLKLHEPKVVQINSKLNSKPYDYLYKFGINVVTSREIEPTKGSGHFLS